MTNSNVNELSTASVKLSTLQVSIAGFTSGTSTRCLIQPLDVLKIRFQLMSSDSTKLPKYRGIIHAVKTIAKEEGLKAFWKGHIPAQILSAFYSTISFTMFEYLKKSLKANSALSPTCINFVSGGVAGMVAIAAVYPIDTVRTRLVAQGEPRQYRNISQAFAAIWKKGGGVKRFYNGLGPSLLMVFPSSAISFTVYHSLRSLNTNQQFVHTSFIFGCIAGICGKVCILPLDLAKKRLQVSGFKATESSLGVAYQYRGMIDCLSSVLRKEGMVALFKGAFPTIIKAGCYSGLLFWTYEMYTNFIHTIIEIIEKQRKH